MANTLIENPLKYFTELLDGEITKAMADTTNKKKWGIAIDEAFPDTAPANIVMTQDTEREAQDKLRRAIEEKRKVEEQGEEASKYDALMRQSAQIQAERSRAMAAQQNDAVRRQQMALGMQNIGQYGASSFPFLSYAVPFGPQAAPEPKPRKPKAPEKTTEEAQRELTETGRRKIILDEEK